ncbi:MAG: hypothetical protein ACT4NP_09455 [Pseudonocardiales bacterium]
MVAAARAKPGETAGVLPVGSTLVLQSGTWEVNGVDEAGAPSVGVIQASLIRPGQSAVDVDLYVARLGGQWFLYETSPL